MANKNVHILSKTKRKYKLVETVNGISMESHPSKRESIFRVSEIEKTHYNYLTDLMKSILEVRRSYYYHFSDVHYERAFAYELYHQWSKHIEEYKKQNPNLCINGEVKKFLLNKKKMPDMVFHEDQNDCQEIVVEIKRLYNDAKKSEFFDDLRTLKDFTTGTIGIGDKSEPFLYGFSPYHLAVFIVTCCRLNNLVDFFSHSITTLQEICKDLKNKGKSGHLYCICSDGDGKLDLVTLEELLQEVKAYQKQKRTMHNN